MWFSSEYEWTYQKHTSRDSCSGATPCRFRYSLCLLRKAVSKAFKLFGSATSSVEEGWGVDMLELPREPQEGLLEEPPPLPDGLIRLIMVRLITFVPSASVYSWTVSSVDSILRLGQGNGKTKAPSQLESVTFWPSNADRPCDRLFIPLFRWVPRERGDKSSLARLLGNPSV